MRPETTVTAIETDSIPALAIGLDKVCWLIIKTREFDVKDAPTEPDPGSNASDDRMISVLEDRPDDPVEEEIRSFISELSEDEQIDLVALTWLARDSNMLADWMQIRGEAARAANARGSSRGAGRKAGASRSAAAGASRTCITTAS